ncbi:MAG TPA: LamG domain-containing protein [Flavobacteriales bacterium]|nr:LamG domain-containing protein [Flavobacteriales bacterium]
MHLAQRFVGLFLSFPAFAQTGPQFHWRLDESNGGTAFASSGGSNGTLAGGTTWAPTGGHHQGAARFDGVDDRIVLGSCDFTNGGSALSLSLWVKPDFVTGMERTLVAKTVGPLVSDHIWSIAFINGTALRFRLKTAGTTTELSTPPSSLFGGTWYHIVAVYDGVEMRLYANGALMANGQKSGSIGYQPQAPAALGATSTGTQPFSGWLDDVRVYDRALSDAEIIDILFESVVLQVDDTVNTTPALTVVDGTVRLPSDGWQSATILDGAGRCISVHPRSMGNTMEVPQTAGSYLVCLQDLSRRTAVRIIVL